MDQGEGKIIWEGLPKGQKNTKGAKMTCSQVPWDHRMGLWLDQGEGKNEIERGCQSARITRQLIKGLVFTDCMVCLLTSSLVEILQDSSI